MKSERIWRDYFLPQLEKSFPNSFIGMLVRTYPKKNILEAAFWHITTPAEVYEFFIEYQWCCRMWQPDNPNSDQSTALMKIIGYMLIKKGGWLEAWSIALEFEIATLQS